MEQEIEAAVNFLTRLVAKSVGPGGSKTTTSKSVDNAMAKNSNHVSKPLSEEKIQEFSRRLTAILRNRFRNHWFPERPSRGQAYRCIRINENCSTDGSIAKACQECGISYESLKLPVELTLWIDPNEVTCRFGEHKGSYCIVTKLSDGRQENYVNSINIEELEQQSLEHSKQNAFDISLSRKKRQQAMMHQRAKNSPISLFANNNSTTYHSHPQSMNGSLSNGTSPAAHLANSSGHPHVPVTTTTQNINGYVDYGPNGLLPTTSSAAVSLQHQQQQFPFSSQPQTHYYSSPNPFQHVVAQHSNHYGSPTSHIFSKYNSVQLGLQQSQQGPSPAGQMAGNRALNASMAGSGTFRSNVASNSLGSKQVNAIFQTSPNDQTIHHNVSAASTVLASLGASQHSTLNGGGTSKSFSSMAPGNSITTSSFARGLQTTFNLSAVPFTPSSLANGFAVASSLPLASSVASSNANEYHWVSCKSLSGKA